MVYLVDIGGGDDGLLVRDNLQNQMAVAFVQLGKNIVQK